MSYQNNDVSISRISIKDIVIFQRYAGDQVWTVHTVEITTGHLLD